jgi:serine/threonine-protein kinase
MRPVSSPSTRTAASATRCTTARTARKDIIAAMSVPQRIGRYRITGEVGRGAMGTVYRGRDDSLDRDVALKVMSQGLADADARTRFQREARAAARLQHPNIVVIYELGEHEGAPYMALELLDGVDLQRAIGGGIRPDPRATLPLVLQLLAGLAHAHENGIVHRDVKPSNLFLPYGKPAKIMDFGVARLSGLGTTTSGAIVGTPNYMSPEQVASGEIDGRSDLFSAGLILYELVTGEKAIQADTVVSAMYKILHEAPDLSLIPSGPGWRRLRAVLERALARRSGDRYPDARAMASELAQALVDLGGTVDWAAPADQALLVRPRAPASLGPATPAPPPEAPGARPSAQRAPRPAVSVAPRARLETSAPPARSRTLLAVAGATVLVALGAATLLLVRSPAPADPGPARSIAPTVLPPSAPPPVASPSPAALAGGHGPTTPASPTTARVTPSATPTTGPLEPATPTAKPPAGATGLGPEARLARSRDLVARGRWADALVEARAVLEAQPTNREASALAQQAEAELVVEECLRNARAALRDGDRERAIDELRRGFLVRKDDPRLLALHREAVQ